MAYAVIDYTEIAKDFCTFSSEANVKIFIHEGNRIVDSMPFNSFNLDAVKKMNIPVIYRLDTSSCSSPPKEFLFLGRLPLRRGV